jgi:2-C-methyl-D-erythritol 2,4-cyclodiphosphate synthase
MAEPISTPSILLNYRIGQGYDVHALVPGRKLIIGGIEVEHTHGLLGHSDADVLIHAIIDAILGAAGLGDIGSHFPDTDSQYKGADSGKLLQSAMASVRAAGYELGNVDATVIAQAPKLGPYREAIQVRLASLMAVEVSRINVKAKTSEKLGFVGRQEGIEALACALLVPVKVHARP